MEIFRRQQILVPNVYNFGTWVEICKNGVYAKTASKFTIHEE